MTDLSAEIVAETTLTAEIDSVIEFVSPYTTVVASEILPRFRFCTAGGYLADPTQANFDLVQVTGIQIHKISAAIAEEVNLAHGGSIVNLAWSFTAGQPVFLAAAGDVTQVVPATPATSWNVLLGVASDATTLVLDIRAPIRLRG